MSANENGVPSQQGVSPQHLLMLIGELTIENRLLRERLQALEQQQEQQPAPVNEFVKEEEVHARN